MPDANALATNLSAFETHKAQLPDLSVLATRLSDLPTKAQDVKV